MTTPRFDFTGFELVRTADSETHEVEVGTVSDGGKSFVVHMIRKVDLPFEADFLLANVYDKSEKEPLWNFRSTGHKGIGLLAWANHDLTIALVGKGRYGKVEDVIPFSAFAGGGQKPVDLRKKVQLKREAAKELGRKFWLTEAERKIGKIDFERDRESREAEKKAAHEARIHARKELVAKVKGRGNVDVALADGRKRFGYPVTEDEWMSMPGGAHVVLVESYDDVSGTAKGPLETFKVVKAHGKKPEKGQPTTVRSWWTAERNKPATPAVRPVGTAIFEIAESALAVDVYATYDEIREAREHGLNGGSYVVASDRMDGDRYEVFAVHTDRVDTVGLFAPIG